ncbi:MAG: uroporphyrinogen-III C-methyltransferase [Bryobacteraceae bacterium]
MTERPGKVWLVGAGPGDPGLLTLEGRRALEGCDAVLYDHLANEELLAFAPAGAERIYVGKKKSDHAVAQLEIERLMIERARQGKCVVRLKGGDPFIFGRGGEEAEALADAGIPFEVVPGVTAPLGIAAYAGVPLTHRDHNSMVTFVTGHDPESIDWRWAAGSETIVVFMGLTHTGEIAQRLIDAGVAPDTPAMAVRWGTRPQQKTIAAPLAELGAAVERARLKPPATLIIGAVVSLYPKLAWFERMPLFGQRIVVTRAREQSGGLAESLRRLGAEAIECPLIEMQPPADTSALDDAIERLRDFDWLVLTSANAVRFFLERLDASRNDLRSLRARICAIGPATRQAVEGLHLKVDLVPAEYVAEGLVAAFAPYDLAGARILIPRAAVARDLVPQVLEQRGAKVEVVTAYRNVVPADATASVERASLHRPIG